MCWRACAALSGCTVFLPFGWQHVQFSALAQLFLSFGRRVSIAEPVRQKGVHALWLACVRCAVLSWCTDRLLSSLAGMRACSGTGMMSSACRCSYRLAGVCPVLSGCARKVFAPFGWRVCSSERSACCFGCLGLPLFDSVSFALFHNLLEACPCHDSQTFCNFSRSARASGEACSSSLLRT